MSDKRPLLSIIIPVFNNELYIKQTLTSVFEQIEALLNKSDFG